MTVSSKPTPTTIDPPPDALTQILQGLRKQHGMTQAELAKCAGITDSAVAHIERGRRSPRRQVVENIARVFKMSKTERSDLIDAVDARHAARVVIPRGGTAPQPQMVAVPAGVIEQLIATLGAMGEQLTRLEHALVPQSPAARRPKTRTGTR